MKVRASCMFYSCSDEKERRPYRSIFKMGFCHYFVTLVLIGVALSAITSTPGIQRVHEGDSCTLQWTFTGLPFYYNYNIQNLTTLPPSGVRGTPVFNRTAGVITLTITNIALWDAGNYSLIIDATNDTTALLYVYQIPRTPAIEQWNYIQQFPVVAQKSIWVDCSTGINSRPSQYSPQILFTFQRDGEEISNQLNRHNINGSRLTINPVLRADDGRLYRCKAQEVGSRLESNYSAVFNLSLHEFKSVPLELQRKKEQEDFSLKWEWTYNVCQFLQSGFYFMHFIIELFHSDHGRVVRGYVTAFPGECYKSLSLNSAYTTRASFTMDNSSATFYLAHILTSDAGYYTLTLSYEFSSSQQQNTSALFVYGYPSLSVKMSSDINVVPTGYSVELTCTANSTSLPAIYRPNMSYIWGRYEYNHIGVFQVRSHGAVALEDGSFVDRYTLTNNNRTLRIASVGFFDNGPFYCGATESGSNKQFWNSIYLNTMYAPVISSTTPFTRKVNVITPKTIYLHVNYNANPGPQAMPSWRFVDMNGVSQPLPPNAVSDWNSVRFILSSVSEYGSYTSRVNNTYGATEATFQVLPLAKPDNPINFRTYYLTSASIFLQWNCSWDNGLQQFFVVQLNETTSQTIVETKNVASPIGCLSNTTIQVKFDTNIQEETDYTASLWSYNDLGSSDVIGLTARTTASPTLLVTPQNIALYGTNATISFSIVNGRAVRLKVECCVESKLVCVGSFFNVSGQDGTITLVNIPSDGSQYAFDFYLYDGPQQNYSLVAFVRNVLKDNGSGAGASNTSLLAAVIALAILFGLSLTALVALLIVHLRIRRSKKSAQGTSQQNDIVTPEGVSNPATNDSPTEEGTIQTIYEGLTERERYQEPKQITYESLRLEENTKGRRIFRK